MVRAKKARNADRAQCHPSASEIGNIDAMYSWVDDVGALATRTIPWMVSPREDLDKYSTRGKYFRVVIRRDDVHNNAIDVHMSTLVLLVQLCIRVSMPVND